MEWSDLFAALPAGAILLDAAGAIQSINPAAERLLGIAAADWLGRADAPFVPPEASERFAWGDLALGVAFSEISPLRLVTFQDRTAQERERRELLEWMRFCLGFDMRGLLSSIRGSLVFLQYASGEPLGGMQREVLGMAEHSARRLSEYAEDLLDIVRYDLGYSVVHTKEPQSITHLINQVATQLRSAGYDDHYVIDLEVADDLPFVPCDTSRAAKLIKVLVNNFFRSSRALVKISARMSGENELSLTIRSTEAWRITDDGTFDRRDNTEMYLAHVLACAHGGRLWVESGEEGSAF
ncbi:MAG TPA: PAS domain-containing protein, partial [Herpetosiphonaceae bacterium]